MVFLTSRISGEFINILIFVYYFFSVKHMGETLYKCDQCGIPFKGSHALKLHKEKTHMGVTFHCNICGKDLADPRGLKRHMTKLHNEQK